MIEHIKIKFKRINSAFNDIQLPMYSTPASSGMDIRAAIDKEVVILPNQVALVPTNLSVEIPEGFEIQVRPRSGLAANHSIGVLNSPGTIDADYRGEIKIILINFGKDDFIISRGERIAQLVVSKIYHADFIEVNELKNTDRGEGGFGHTGRLP
jgi:dUTP pyrophosphatase